VTKVQVLDVALNTGAPAVAPSRSAFSGLIGIMLMEDEMRRKGSQDGYLRERNGNWFVQFREWRRTLQGNLEYKRVEKLVGPAKGSEKLSRARAREKAREMVGKANGVNANPGGMIQFGEFYDSHYRPDIEIRASKNWQKSKGSIVQNHILPTFEKMPLGEIDTRRVQMLLSAKVDAGLSTQTIAHIRNCLSSILRHARRCKFITGQLATEDCIIPEVRHKERRALTLIQLRMLAEAMPPRWRALVLVMGRHGLRIGEAAGLCWKDVNLTDEPIISNGELIQPNSLYVRSNWTAGERREPKAKQRRHIPLVAETWVALSLHLEISKWTAPDSPVFAGHTGNPVDGHNVARRSLATAATSIGTPWVTWHSFRHTSATLADRAGLTPAEKQKLLGHRNADMTIRYTHPDMERVREQLERVN
jgi:integrase